MISVQNSGVIGSDSYLRQACSKIEVRVCVVRIMLYGFREMFHSFLWEEKLQTYDMP